LNFYVVMLNVLQYDVVQVVLIVREIDQDFQQIIFLVFFLPVFDDLCELDGEIY